MLKVCDLTKIYKTKKGSDVHALDGVTLEFAEKGMVFLLGKSGSGKSTLLNVCGGLDTATSGEIIVKGRSSKSFSQSDFDSYRNTFIGFIFQEYNILNEFSVEDNIALALELQGKPKDKKAIAELLEQVDLTGYAKRKPNTLSGGQKQRIAIARALIKSPEIIMADEPTGALDSNTGRQVFETLKKLSENKLVIVVSHDREFAEQYGDRIIELQDGKVISDVSKVLLKQDVISENLNNIGDVLCIKNGADLSDGDFNKIKAFLKNAKKDIIIAKNEADIKSFKKANRINADGIRETFKSTDTEKITDKEYTKSDSHFIRSKLPFRHAIKIGISSLKTKPIRLFFTIILCTVAFTLLGLLSTLNFYNSEATFKETLSDISLSNIQLNKFYKLNSISYYKGEAEYEYESKGQGKFSPDEIKSIAQKYSSDAFGAITSSGNFNLRINNSKYFKNQVKAFAFLPQDNSLHQKINGSYPQSKNEILITAYIAEMFKECQISDKNGNIIELAAKEDILGKTISLNGESYKVSGIIDFGEIPSQYEQLKTATEENRSLENDFDYYLADSLHQIVFVTEDRLPTILSNNEYWVESILNYTQISSVIKQISEQPKYCNVNYKRLSDLASSEKVIYINNKTELKNNEVILSHTYFAEAVREYLNYAAEQIYNNNPENYMAAERLQKMQELCYPIIDGGSYSNDKESVYTPFTAEQLEAKVNELISALKKEKISLKLNVQLVDQANESFIGKKKELSVAGVAVVKQNRNENTNSLILSKALFDSLWDEQNDYIEYYFDSQTNYKEPENALYNTAYVPFEYTEELADDYWDIYQNNAYDNNDSQLKIASSFIYNLQMVDDMVKTMSTVFLYTGLVFALFAALLLSNFISVSISQKKREIGILRAVGARSLDVFKIFFSESFTITAICIALSTASSIAVCNLINSSLMDYIGASLFVFGIISFIILVAISLLTAIIATFLPVYNAAKKKPVDSIRSI